ncbi:thymidylate kinase isoform X2 [Gossypium hirsutum]|nr:thymidylate kinase-like isoform X2 [Gossypium hirsutum]XP_040973493.1 thymidylate kinase-like isoform X2 [Gossypium hirsutum]
MEISDNCTPLSANNESRGTLVVFEGLDRSGKTSQCGRLVSYLEGLGHSVEIWRFPDRTTSVGQMISAYLTNKSQLDDHTIHLLFSANRWEKRSMMETKMKAGTTLIVDRYSYSGVAFSTAKGLDFEWCKAPETGLIAPDLVVYLDITPEGKQRGNSRVYMQGAPWIHLNLVKYFNTGIVVALKIHLILDVLLLLMLLTTTNAGSPLSPKTDAASVSL